MLEELKIQKGNLVELKDKTKCIVTKVITFIVNHDGTVVRSTYPVTLSNLLSYTDCGELRLYSKDSRDIASVLKVSDGTEISFEQELYVFYDNKAYKQEKYNGRGRIDDEH